VSEVQTGIIETRVPGRLDRLPWSRWHWLVETGKEVNVFYGYTLGALPMIGAGVAEWFIGVEAAGRSLEDVARPLTAEEEGTGATT
jgi:hypothetical protein